MRFPKSKFGVKKSSSGFLNVMKPNCVEDYNKNMGGTHLADQCFQYYSHTHRSLKWWKGVFFYMLNICIVNVSNLDFRIGIVHGLLLGWERNATHNLTLRVRDADFMLGCTSVLL